MNILRNIVAIDRIPAGMITALRRVDATSVKLFDSLPWAAIKIKVPARLTISDKIEDGVRLYTAQLVFRTCEDLTDTDRMVYRCKTADGRCLLVGSNLRPYPVSTVSMPHPDNLTDSQLNEVNVNYMSSYRIPYIL